MRGPRQVLALGLLLGLVLSGTVPAGEPAADKSRAEKLADYFNKYYQEAGEKKPELLATLKEIGALFEPQAVREFAWGEKFAYEDLVRWNDLVNAELEKEGYHAYIVEQPGRGFVYLRCLLGKLEKKEPGREFEILGHQLAVDVYTISELRVGSQPFLRFDPSFYSDRKRIYGLTGMWRKRYGGLVWSRFEKWRAKGLNPAEDASLDRILPEPSMENCIEQMVYRAWREAYNRAAADGDKAAESFARECGDAMMRNCLPEEAAHALQNQNRKIFVLQEEAVPLLAAISTAAQPHAVLADLCSYGKMEPDSPYRKACDEAVPALAEEALKLARSNKDVAAMFGKEIPASAEAARALLYRLDEKSIRAAAAAALKSLGSKAGGAAPAPVLAPLRAN